MIDPADVKPGFYWVGDIEGRRSVVRVVEPWPDAGFYRNPDGDRMAVLSINREGPAPVNLFAFICRIDEPS
jgi:hypothetical protein